MLWPAEKDTKCTDMTQMDPLIVTHMHSSILWIRRVHVVSLIPTSSSISSCEVPSLDHKILDDSVELCPFVAITFLPRDTLSDT